MANDPKSDEEQGKRDIKDRPVIKETEETKRKEKEGTEDPADPGDVAKS